MLAGYELFERIADAQECDLLLCAMENGGITPNV